MSRLKVNLGIRGSIEERDRLKGLATAQNTTIQDLVESAIRRYLSDETVEHPGTVLNLPPLSEENRAWLLLAAHILAYNPDEEANDMIKRALSLTAKTVIDYGQEQGQDFDLRLVRDHGARRLQMDINRRLAEYLESTRQTPRHNEPSPRSARNITRRNPAASEEDPPTVRSSQSRSKASPPSGPRP